MTFTVEPLYLISIVVNLVIGLLVLFLYWGQNNMSAKYWFFASLALSFGVGFILFRPLVPAFLSYSVAHILSTSSSILFGCSLLLLVDKKAKPPYLFLLVCVAYGLVLAYLVNSGSGRLVPVVVAVAWCISLIFPVFLSWRVNNVLKNGYVTLMMWLFVASAILWVMRIPTLVAGLIETLGSPGLINVGILASIVILGIARQLAYLAIRLSEIFKVRLSEQIKKTFEAQEAMIVSLIELTSKRDNETGCHIVRTAQYVKVLATRLKQSGKYSKLLTRDRIQDFYRAAPLHDIGKVGIPDAILNKPGKLNPSERAIMNTHASIGKAILITAKASFFDPPNYLNHAIEISGGAS